MRSTAQVMATLMALALATPGCSKQAEAPAPPPAAPQSPLATAREKAQAFATLPANFDSDTNPWTQDKADLGRMLYYETRMSKGQDISCNSCHQLDRFGVDGEPTSPGFEHQRGSRNSPTVYNAAGHLAQFWDGRSADVEEQAKGPILNPVEMAMPDGETVVATLKSIPGYVAAFAKAFPGEADPVNYDNMAKAIGVFERRLTTPSRWDDFLGGKDDALSAAEIEGFVTFAEVGCMSCHNGPLVGGNSYQKLGAVTPWPGLVDEGRADATKNPEDKGFFKVPSLRNIAKTGPYFHDGKVAKLDEAVTMMARHQLGRELEPTQVAAITTWLDALTGTVPTDYVAKPELPPSVAVAPADPADS
ncbi:MAG: cytochrome-c peroxidase, partial [Deltaproteobacteria bacterium HGW-Deltaproteobacteria-14]